MYASVFELGTNIHYTYRCMYVHIDVFTYICMYIITHIRMYINPTIKYHHNAIFSTSTGSQATPEIPAHTDQQSERKWKLQVQTQYPNIANYMPTAFQERQGEEHIQTKMCHTGSPPPNHTRPEHL